MNQNRDEFLEKPLLEMDEEDSEEVEGEPDSYIEDNSEKPFDPEKIRVDVKPISVGQMVTMLNDENNRVPQINLDPDFQRRQIWNERKRKSLLIESLMLRIPLPVFYVYEDEESRWHVVDGLQRMSTINDFIKGKFYLSDLQYLKHLNGKKFDKLDQKYVNRIETTTLTINVIDATTPPQVKYDIFRRINTGGIPLNAQEIRNSTASNKTRNFFKELTGLESFKKATGSMPDLRMQAQELILRFVAFYLNYDYKNNDIKYKKSMDNFLDKAYESINKLSNQELQEIVKKFDSAMINANLLFGRYAFRRTTLEELESNFSSLRSINKSLFTCISVLLTYYENEISKNTIIANELLRKIAFEMQNNSSYEEAFSKGTGDYGRIKIQFNETKKIFDEVLLNVK